MFSTALSSGAVPRSVPSARAGPEVSVLKAAQRNPGLPTAVNITWSSINFKTILKWQPKPSGYFYTEMCLEKKCIMTTETECDVTDALRNVKETYTAHILSVKSLVEDNFEEPLFASSEKFTPYNQTIIGKPEIQHYTQEDSKLNVVFRDPLTPYMFSNGSFQSVRDIFKHDLEYKLYYWKDQSSGKKDATTKSHMFDISVDNKNNYCFYVQGIIPSRRENRNGQESMVLCTTIERTILDGMYLVKSVVLTIVFVFSPFDEATRTLSREHLTKFAF
uniref:Tissue factor n=1 Tax=Meleagris gallopavo TaxID=9103 RepID=G1N6B7_MELGA